MTLTDAEARARIRDDFSATLVVEAAAGTGKTTELVRRIAGLLRSGEATLDRVVAVTFTDKAAGEMKLRLRGELERERQSASATAEERARLEAALEALETAHIGTIHSFCLDMLRERPVEASVDPAFEVVAEPRPLLERAFDKWYQAALDDPPEALRRVLATRRWSYGEGPRDMLVGAAEQLVERRDFDAPWSRPPFDREDRIDAMVAQVAEVGALAAVSKSPKDPLARGLDHLQRFADDVERRERVRERDYDRLEYELGQLARHRDAFKGKGYGKQYGEGLERQDVLDRRDAVRVALEAFASDADADLAASLQAMLREVVAGYQALKERAGALDYLDMLVCVRDMLQGDAAVRGELQRRFSHLFVDEFQDTDPLQAEILLLIAADDPACDRYLEVRPVPGKLFVVGDPKQAIYRFRRADVVLYQRIKEQLREGGADVLYLTTSFRSLPAIQSAVNVAFAPEMTGGEEGWQADYVPLHRHREARARQPAVVALPVPDPYSEYGNLSNAAIRASEPEAVAAFVAWLVEQSGWTVAERRGGEETLTPVEARHVCLLFRGFHSFWEGDITRPYVRGLEARKIPHVLVGGRAYHGREEVLALRSALTAIEWPHDELSVYATLRGPFFSFGDDALFRDRLAHGRLHPLRRVEAPAEKVDERSPDEQGADGHRADEQGADEQGAAIAEALALLASLHRRRNRRPIAATIQELLTATRAHAGIAIWPTGEQALANILRAMDDARRFEHGGGTSFRAFVDHLDDAARHGRGAEAPVLEEGTDGVRIMTVHGAKGLEFPIVILCDMAKARATKRPSRHVDAARRLWAFSLAGCVPADLREHGDAVLAQDEAEAVRVAYVAATRARDLLVVPAVGDSRRSGWVDPLNAAVYPPHEAWRDAEAAPGCPAFGLDSVRYRPARTQASPEHAVAPGLHRAAAGGLGAVWWDPSLLELDVDPVGGLRQMELLEEGVLDEGGDEEHRAWRERRARAVEAASRPRHRHRPITALAHELAEAQGGGRPVDVADTGVDRQGRPRGPRFGTLVHAVLALASFDASRAEIEAIASSQALLLGATTEERVAAARAASAALEHPLIRAAAASRDCRREVPLVAVLDDGRIAEGIADLVFRQERGWRIVDFKTDAEVADASVYAEQLELYGRAVGAATGEPVTATLLRV